MFLLFSKLILCWGIFYKGVFRNVYEVIDAGDVLLKFYL